MTITENARKQLEKDMLELELLVEKMKSHVSGLDKFLQEIKEAID